MLENLNALNRFKFATFCDLFLKAKWSNNRRHKIRKKNSTHSTFATAYSSLIPTLFRNKRFMLDEMTQQNASKFAIFLEYEK